MKKIIILIILMFSCLSLFACDETELNKEDLNITDELTLLFKSAYANSIKDSIDNANLDEINILEFYGKINDAYVVSMDNDITYNNKSRIIPYDIYDEDVENMRFSYYGYRKPIYLIKDGNLYTIKQSYENNIINFNEVCLLFGIQTSGLETFSEKDHNILKESMTLWNSKLGDNYKLRTYYGEYGDYIVVDYNTLIVFGVASSKTISNFMFTYGYSDMAIRVINKSEVLSLSDAYNRAIINEEELYEIFTSYSRSAKIDKKLVDMLLSIVYDFLNGIKDDLQTVPDINKIYLERYYGNHFGYEMFSFETDYKLKTNSENPLIDKFVSLKYGFGETILYKDGEMIPLVYAVENGIIDIEEYRTIRDL